MAGNFKMEYNVDMVLQIKMRRYLRQISLSCLHK